MRKESFNNIVIIFTVHITIAFINYNEKNVRKEIVNIIVYFNKKHTMENFVNKIVLYVVKIKLK